MNITFSNGFEHQLDSIYFKIIHGVIFFLGDMFALIFYSGFIHFEYYGGDPLKRSLKNKLLAQICNAVILLWLDSSPYFIIANRNYIISVQVDN